MASIKNATLMWTKAHKADQYGKYTVNAIITEDDVKQLQNDNLGHIVHKISDITKQEYRTPYEELADGRLYYATFKRDAVDNNGKVLPAPKVVDAKAVPFSEPVGNGSKGIVYYHPQKYTKPKPGWKVVWDGLQVLDLVPFGEPVVNFEVQEGFSQEAEQSIEESFS